LEVFFDGHFEEHLVPALFFNFPAAVILKLFGSSYYIRSFFFLSVMGFPKRAWALLDPLPDSVPWNLRFRRFSSPPDRRKGRVRFLVRFRPTSPNSPILTRPLDFFSFVIKHSCDLRVFPACPPWFVGVSLRTLGKNITNLIWITFVQREPLYLSPNFGDLSTPAPVPSSPLEFEKRIFLPWCPAAPAFFQLFGTVTPTLFLIGLFFPKRFLGFVTPPQENNLVVRTFAGPLLRPFSSLCQRRQALFFLSLSFDLLDLWAFAASPVALAVLSPKKSFLRFHSFVRMISDLDFCFFPSPKEIFCHFLS